MLTVINGVSKKLEYLTKIFDKYSSLQVKTELKNNITTTDKKNIFNPDRAGTALGTKLV